MPKRAGKNGELWKQLISDENLTMAIDEVNRTHHWRKHHRPNPCTAWVEETKEARVAEMRKILTEGFEPKPPRVMERWDASAQKWRTISEPAQWPDQYVHHALIAVLQPVMMRGMDAYCCGSIRKRGAEHARRAMERWVRHDKKGTKYLLTCDVYHFYESLKPKVVMARMRQLVKDAKVLDLIERVLRNGVLIGAYTSQWFANTVLQPLDALIRQSGCAKHYKRYMDNMDVFGANRRKLRRLRVQIEQWLNAHGLRLKGDWQIFPVGGEPDKTPLGNPRNGVTRPKGRIPNAVGYRFGRCYTLPRKHNLLRLKRAIARYRKRRDEGRPIALRMARSILASLGQLRHCNNVNLYRILFQGERIQRELKRVVRANIRKEDLTWNMYLAQRARRKSSKQRATATAG